ncbi:hypothetical protein M3Y97_00901700 [Aphelenchoides bicaudatus]|nr:hypothetical protein M3Y97_00901700 [Aphelenchoides bicaudatus]
MWKMLSVLVSLSVNNRFMAESLATNRHHHAAIAKDDFSISASSSEERPKFPPDMLAALKRPICQKDAACHFSSKNLGFLEDYVFNLCDCPVEKPCGIGAPVRTNDMDYYMCGHHKPPRCKRGQTSLIVEGLQTKILCRCRKKSLIQVQKSATIDEFVCGKPHSKIWIRKIQKSSEQNSAEYYNVYR